MTSQLGTINRSELAAILRALARARPDLIEALALVATATGIEDELPDPPRIVVEMPRRIEEGTK